MHFTIQKQIGVAKEMNRVLLKKVWCLLSNVQLDKLFWAETLVYASHLIFMLTTSMIGGKILLEIWSGETA